MDEVTGHLPPELWSTTVVAAALASCDFSTLLEEIRRAHGWTQKQLASAVGYSQSWVSNVLRGQQALTVDQVREISRKLGVPVHLLRFSDTGGDDPTKRRDFGKAMALALIPLPARSEVDETTALTLTAITGAQRRLDATTPARELARGVAAHVEMANYLLSRARKSPFAGDIAAAVSEAAGFAAWLHAVMHDIGSARTYYRLAIDRARLAKQNLLAAYMLGSLAAFEIDGDDPGLGLALIAEARRQIGEAPHPTPQAWLDSIEALSLAAIGKGADADNALTRARKAVERTSELAPCKARVRRARARLRVGHSRAVHVHKARERVRPTGTRRVVMSGGMIASQKITLRDCLIVSSRPACVPYMCRRACARDETIVRQTQPRAVTRTALTCARAQGPEAD